MTNQRPDFLSASWELNPAWSRFRVGTCRGLWRAAGDAYMILAIKNDEPGNGDFKHTLSWFYDSCSRDNRNLLILEVGGLQELGLSTDWLKGYLKKEGFEEMEGSEHMIKRFT